MRMELDVAQPVLLGPGEGETTTDRPERSIQILCDFPQIIVSRFRYEPGEEGPDPHVHHQHADAFYVLEGEVEFGLGPDVTRVTGGPGTFACAPPDVVHRLGAGGFVSAPAGARHGFSVAGAGPLRVLNLHAPDRGFVGRLRG